jgi:mannose-1-phosphate guanylyltransferase
MALPSDHHIRDEAGFRAAIERAVKSAAKGPITTIGIKPTRPETGFGHIESSDEIEPGVRRAIRFVEKPDRQRAEEYVQSGRYFWNSGMFFFPARTMLAAIVEHLPELSAGILRIETAAKRGDAAEAEETRAVFPALPSISIDYGVMEKVKPIHIVPADFGWSDVGSWLASYELGTPDAAGNVADEGAVLVEATNNLVRNLGSSDQKKVIALLGVSDLCVIETDDALLVIPRERAQDVRKVVEALQKLNRDDRL